MTVKILLSKREKKYTHCCLRGTENIKQNNRIQNNTKI